MEEEPERKSFTLEKSAFVQKEAEVKLCGGRGRGRMSSFFFLFMKRRPSRTFLNAN